MTFEEKTQQLLYLITLSTTYKSLAAATYAQILVKEVATEGLTIIGRRTCEFTGQYYFDDWDYDHYGN